MLLQFVKLTLVTLFSNQKIKYSADSSIASVAAATPALSTLLAAVKAANLTEKLSDPKLKTTLFAPTDDAFAAYLSANNLTAAQLLASPDLKWILKNHFVKKAAIKVRGAEWRGMVEKEGKRKRFLSLVSEGRRHHRRLRERGLFSPSLALSPMLRLAGQLQGLHMKDVAASSVSFSPCSSSRRLQPP